MRRSGVRIPSAPQNEEGPDTFFVRSFIVLWMCMGGFGRRSEARARTAPLSSTRRKPRLTSGNAESQAGFFLGHSDPASLRVPAPTPLSVPLGPSLDRKATGLPLVEGTRNIGSGRPVVVRPPRARTPRRRPWSLITLPSSVGMGRGQDVCPAPANSSVGQRPPGGQSRWFRGDGTPGRGRRYAGRCGTNGSGRAVSVWPPWDESER